MPGLTMGAGLVPPLQLNLGSSATSGAVGGSAAGGGMGALNEGDWITQSTGTGNNAATATTTPAAQAAAVTATAHPLIIVALAVGVWWMCRHK